MKDFLLPEEIKILTEKHHDSAYRKQADRIKTILCLNRGLSFEEIAKLLLLDDTTVRRYFKKFKKTGIDGLLESRYQGSSGFLTTDQEVELAKHLRKNTYQTVKEIVAHVKNTYHKTYSVEGMTHLLHRLDFVYKKTKVI